MKALLGSRVVCEAFLLALTACTHPVSIDTDDVRDYPSWGDPIIVTSDSPGHSGYREIYANPIAQQHTSAAYDKGAIIMQIGHSSKGGPIDEVVIARQIYEKPDGYDHEGGWLFTSTNEDGEERYDSRCWRECHSAAPYRGLFLFYGQR